MVEIFNDFVDLIAQIIAVVLLYLLAGVAIWLAMNLVKWVMALAGLYSKTVSELSHLSAILYGPWVLAYVFAGLAALYCLYVLIT